MKQNDKPQHIVSVDDRAFRFRGNWDDLINETEKLLFIEIEKKCIIMKRESNA